MTICIAAGCYLDQKKRGIILCSDWRLSGSLGSADVKLKSRRLASKWFCLTSGYETDINAALIYLQAAFQTTPEIDETNLMETVRQALRKRRRDQVEEYIQGRFSISYDQFLASGKSWVPSDLFNSVALATAEITLGAEFVVAGFDKDGIGHLCETTDRAEVSFKEDFALVGEGRFLASAALMQRGYIDVKYLPEAIYYVYEAKKYAERVASVGELTTLALLDQEGKAKLVNYEGFEYLDGEWKKFGPQAVGEPPFDKKKFMDDA